MQRNEIEEIRSRLLNEIPGDPNQVSGPADRIQKLATFRTDLTKLCEYCQAQRMRRLVILPLAAWTDREARWAQEALTKIANLRNRPGPDAALGLACFGVLRADFETALALLANSAHPDDGGPAPIIVDEQKTAKVKVKKEKATPKPAQLESLEDLDETELDEQTMADLDALKREINGLKK